MRLRAIANERDEPGQWTGSPDCAQEHTGKGRGGTEYRPGFEWLDEKGIEPGVCLYFTDMECSDYPEVEPRFPTIWCDYGDADSPWRHPAPWGEHIRIAA